MYQIDELVDNRWVYVYESEDIKEIDKILFKLTKLNIPTRVMNENLVIIFLDGTDYEYKYWKDNYVRKPKNLERVLKR